jgi:general secretion pathway protein D
VAFLNADGLRAVLSFLNSDEETEVVATPRAVTLDNETAKLAVTKLYPNFKITPGSQTSPAGADITYTNLGTTLEVTPRVAGTNMIALKVVPEVANIYAVEKKTVSGLVNEANIYAIRRIETHVLIPSGNTLVMGGLMSDRKTRAYTKVPLLGDIPGIGLLFRKDRKEREKSNLLIFVTPTIVEDGDFQVSTSTFLKTPPPKEDDSPESAWDSGKPYDWKSGPSGRK